MVFFARPCCSSSATLLARTKLRLLFSRRSTLFMSDLATTRLCVPKIEDYKKLFKDNQSEKKISLVLMEYYFLRETGFEVPLSLSVKDMKALLEMNSATQRSKYFKKYLCSREKTVTKILKRDCEKKEERKLYTPEAEHIRYNLGHNSLHFRIEPNSINSFYTHRLSQAVKFGQPLVFDFDYDEYMSRHECMNAAQQIQLSYAANRLHSDPFDLHLCNLRKEQENNKMLPYLDNSLRNFETNAKYMLTVSEKCFLDLFHHKRKLIYLSPNAPEVMDKFDHDATYIIGCLVDRSSSLPRSLGKAKKKDVLALKLPLDKYFLFNSGGAGKRSLPLNVMTNILLDLKASGDWKEAFKHIPKHKIFAEKQFSKKERNT